MSDSDSEFWEKLLKHRCNDCYDLNRYREVRNARLAPYGDGWLLDIRYCDRHQKLLHELSKSGQ